MDNLNDKQLRFINAYFKYNNIKDICNSLNITRPTYYKYMSDTDIKDAIIKQRLDIMQSAVNNLQTNLMLCSDELIKIVKSDETTPQTKINAINCIFNNCYKLTEQVDIINKINDLEQRLSEQ